MSARLPGGRRALFVVGLLCLFVLAQAANLTLEHHQHRASEHCCLSCHSGPLPFLQTTAGFALLPSLAVAWFAPAVEFQDTHDVLIATSSSRAPPA